LGRPRVSFILPVFNGEETLERCLGALQGISLREWECVAVDDGSGDRGAAIVEAFGRRDKRFRLLRHGNNRGVGAARNTGLSAAVGEAIHFLDQDDLLLPSGIERLAGALTRCPDAAAVFGNFLAVHAETGRRTQWESYPSSLGFSDLVDGSPFTFLTVLHERRRVVGVGGMAEGVDGCDEWDLWGRLTRTGRRLHHCDADVGEYQIHGRNASLDGARLLRSGLKVLDVLHQPDARVPDPAPEWAGGAALAGKTRRQARFFWLQTGNYLAQQRVEDAVALVDILEDLAGPRLVRHEDAGDLHAGMKYGCMLTGLDPTAYFLERADVLDRYFALLEVRLGTPGFAVSAQRMLLVCFVEDLIRRIKRLEGRVERYRCSRSCRIGRALTRSLGRLLGRSG
jgi:hypothetical protein